MSEYLSPYYDQPVLTVTPAGSKAIDDRIAAAVEAERARIVAWVKAEAQREGNDDTAYTMRRASPTRS